MKISREIPARKEILDILWCRSNFLNYGEMEAARSKVKIKTQKNCFWCRSKFQSVDIVGLVGIKGKKNQLVCQACVPVFKPK
jgi:hypothetical protein